MKRESARFGKKHRGNAMIGIIGGIGPYGGLHLHKCILDQTSTVCDQDHLPVIHINIASSIPDRTEFLSGKCTLNPAIPISKQIRVLYHAGARVVGISCNTAHAAPIFNVIKNHVDELAGLTLVNMIDELFAMLQKSGTRTAGLFATLGSYQCNLFTDYGRRYGVDVILPDTEQQRIIHDTIYNKKDGLKVTGHINRRIQQEYDRVLQSFLKSGVNHLILGCTEVSMALDSEIDDFRLFRTTDILAGALIREYRELTWNGPEKMLNSDFIIGNEK